VLVLSPPANTRSDLRGRPPHSTRRAQRKPSRYSCPRLALPFIHVETLPKNPRVAAEGSYMSNAGAVALHAGVIVEVNLIKPRSIRTLGVTADPLPCELAVGGSTRKGSRLHSGARDAPASRESGVECLCRFVVVHPLRVLRSCLLPKYALQELGP